MKCEMGIVKCGIHSNRNDVLFSCPSVMTKFAAKLSGGPDMSFLAIFIILRNNKQMNLAELWRLVKEIDNATRYGEMTKPSCFCPAVC